jgi:peptidoglycan-associated lipoprotein
MKAIRFITLIAITIALSFVAVGCKNPQNVKTMHGTRENPGDIGGQPQIIPNPLPIDTNAPMIPLNDTNKHVGWIEDPNQFKDQTIHFAYDSSVVRSQDKSKVAAVASHLKSNPQTAVRVEGNCDERGTEEYNRSLGERRALAAREELIGLGVDASRVDTISYGEDKPVATGHSEASWKQNRRADFVLLTPPTK